MNSVIKGNNLFLNHSNLTLIRHVRGSDAFCNQDFQYQFL